MTEIHELFEAMKAALDDAPVLLVPRTRKDWIKFYAANKHGHCRLTEHRQALSMGVVKDDDATINWDYIEAMARHDAINRQMDRLIMQAFNDTRIEL